MKSVVHAGTVVTMNPARQVLTDASVFIVDGKIEDIATGFKTPSGARVIDARDAVVIPGLVNAHTHTYGLLLQGAPIPAVGSFVEFLEEIWFHMDSSLAKEDVRASTLMACAEMARSGITTFADSFSAPGCIEGSLDVVADAVEEAGLRACIAYEATGRSSMEEAFKGLAENERFIKANRRNTVTGMVGVHATFTCSEPILRRAAELASQLDAMVQIHLQEVTHDVDKALADYGVTPVQLLKRIGFLTPKVLAAHCVQVSADEIQILAQNGVRVSHNPSSNLSFANAIAPLPQLLDSGLTVGIGEDGTLFDLFETMRCSVAVQRYKEGYTTGYSEAKALELATVGGARALGLEESIGSIEVGKQADMVILDGFPHPIHVKTVASYVVSTGVRNRVRATLVGGRTVFDGRLRTVDEEAVTRGCREAACALWHRMGLS